jgi:hypothetical protein
MYKLAGLYRNTPGPSTLAVLIGNKHVYLDLAVLERDLQAVENFLNSLVWSEAPTGWELVVPLTNHSTEEAKFALVLGGLLGLWDVEPSQKVPANCWFAHHPIATQTKKAGIKEPLPSLRERLLTAVSGLQLSRLQG